MTISSDGGSGLELSPLSLLWKPNELAYPPESNLGAELLTYTPGMLC